MPPLPDIHAFAVLGLTVAALYLFAREVLRTETTSLAVVLALVILFYAFPHGDVQPATFFANFGHPALITVCALLVVCYGLERTGALEPLVTSLARTWRTRPRLALGLTLFGSAITSARRGAEQVLGRAREALPGRIFDPNIERPRQLRTVSPLVVGLRPLILIEWFSLDRTSLSPLPHCHSFTL